MMMFHTAISGGVFLGPLINAYIVQYAGWRVRNISLYAISRASNHRPGGCIMLPALSGLPSPRKTILLIRMKWMCGFMAIAASATFVVAIFTVHETAYKREIINYDLPETEYNPKRDWFAGLSLTTGYDSQASFWGWLGSTLVLLA